MNLFRNQNGDIYAYSDEDFINLARQKYPLRKISDDEIENNFTTEELNIKGREIIIDDYDYTPFSYTPEELAAKQAAEAAALLVSQAKAQIHRDEHLWNNQILWNRYNNEQKTILTNYYDDLIAVTRGESDILPTLTFKGL